MLDLDNLNLVNDADVNKEPDLPVPSIEDQKKIVEILKKLEEAGELTPELLEAYMTGKKKPE